MRINMKQLITFILLINIFCFTEENKIEITKQSKILVYSSYFWNPCNEAKELLRSRGIAFDEKKITFSRKTTEELSKLSGGVTSVPQLIVDGQYFGGLKKLKAYFSTK